MGSRGGTQGGRGTAQGMRGVPTRPEDGCPCGMWAWRALPFPAGAYSAAVRSARAKGAVEPPPPPPNLLHSICTAHRIHASDARAHGTMGTGDAARHTGPYEYRQDLRAPMARTLECGPTRGQTHTEEAEEQSKSFNGQVTSTGRLGTRGFGNALSSTFATHARTTHLGARVRQGRRINGKWAVFTQGIFSPHGI